MPALFASVLFLNALLLFWVQPLFAKMVLPLLGGSPSVWTTCMLFFQAALLVGYAYSHASIRVLGVRRHALVHGVLVWLPLLFLPMDVAHAAAPPPDQPIAWLLRLMGSSIGLPFVALASTAPLLQRWFSETDTRASADPYWLYSASNAGSLLALLAFPMVLEPLIPLQRQQVIWKIGYGIVAALLATCAWLTFRRTSSVDVARLEPADSTAAARTPSAGDRLRWLGLSFAPSSLLLGVTTYISTDVAPVPLLWVVPLACYLLTFIVAFGWYSDTVRAWTVRVLPHVLLPLILLMFLDVSSLFWIAVPIHIAAFSAIALLCHGELARERPGVSHLTEFYLWLAVGGVMGGLFNSLIAPRVFDSIAEYPIAIAIGCLLCVARGQLRRTLANPQSLAVPAFAAAMAAALLIGGRLGGLDRVPAIAFLGVPALLCLSVSKDVARFSFGVLGLFGALAVGNAVSPADGGQILHAERTFFGVYRVRTDRQQHFVSLMHGTTTHGRQLMGAVNPEPSTYYHRHSPIGQLFEARGERAQSVGVIGLGAGTLAAYARPGDTWRFYEIDSAMERIARDTRFFRYLDRCADRCSVVVGDARRSLAASSLLHDVLVLDAFSSDAIPLHLLTTEAVQIYQSRLSPDGIMAFHVSNRHITLRPVLGRIARARGLFALARFDKTTDATRGDEASDWVMMAARPETLHELASDSRWTKLESDARPAWSDDFSNILTELR